MTGLYGEAENNEEQAWVTGGFDARVCVAVFSHGFQVNTSPAQLRLIPELTAGHTEGEG